MIIQKFVSIVITLFVCVSAVVCEAPEQNIDTILSKLEKQDLAIKDLQADYTQTLTYLATDEQFVSGGIFKHKKPNYIYPPTVPIKERKTKCTQ